MWIFYLVAVIPVFVGAYFWYRNHEIIYQEWLIGSLVGFLIAAIFHFAVIRGMTRDLETWSGQIVTATHHPEWVEEYEVTHYTYDKDGNITGSYTTTHYRTHPEHWTAQTDVDKTYEITAQFFGGVVQNFGNLTTETPYKSGFHSGDRNIYVAYNHKDYIYPVTALKSFENRVKAAPSLFSFSKVPEQINRKVFEWPENPDWLRSDRLLGLAQGMVDQREWDLLNTRLGRRKQVNLILIGFAGDSSLGEYQRAKYLGGRKNNLVLCYGVGTGKKTTWSYVFGWTEGELVKQNLQSLLLTNIVSTKIIPLIEREVIQNYQIKDWSKFDYISVQPPGWSYWVLIVVMGGVQTALWVFFHHNQSSKQISYNTFRRVWR